MKLAARALLGYVLGILALIGAGFIYQAVSPGAAIAWFVVLAVVAVVLVRQQRQFR